MSDHRRVSERLAASPVGGLPRGVVILVIALLLTGWVFLYRFNTLGGAFGGFDDDHFLYFALAKQVEAGEQPLRDFQDGMHGAWPSLTYELSAAAQRLFGDNLRSEALLTVSGVALGAAAAFIAGSSVAPWPWALITALLSALISPKLYGYPKVLVTAVAALIIVTTRGLPTWRRLALMSAWTAVAFLFRHDLAVYCGVGFVTLIGLSEAASWRERVRRVLVYGAITMMLLAPSLLWIQRYRGLTEYFRNSLEMSRTEALRTEIGWPRLRVEGQSVAALLSDEENTKALIYYLIAAVPVLVVGITLWRRLQHGADEDQRVAALMALSVMTAVLWYAFLRGNLAGRFGDMAAPVAALSAYLLAVAFSRGRPWPRTLATGAVATALLVTTAIGTWNLGEVRGELRTARLFEPQDVFARARRASQDLSEMPRSLREEQAADRMQAADYLHRCTKPTDRVIAIGYYPDVPAFSGRLFAGGRVTFVPGYYADERYVREALAKLESQSVPIVLGGHEVDDPALRLLAEYLRAKYDQVGVVTINQGSLRVWTRRGVNSTPSGPNGLPCFG